MTASPNRLWLLLGVAGSFVGCEGCRDEKPYTPFGVVSTEAPPPPPPSASMAAPDAGAKPPEVLAKKAVFAVAGASTFRIAERDLESPSGRVFEQLLDADLDGDGKAEIAAWTLPAPNSDGGAPGELWLYTESDSKKILDFPAFVPTGSDCQHKTILSLPGPRTLGVDLTASCTTRRLARSPMRALAFVDAGGTGAPRFGLRVAESAPGETLTFALSARDEDADGRHDYRVTVTLGGAAADATAAANVVWFDRAAGVSRDAREPSRGLESLLGRELIRAKQKKSAASAVARVGAVRRLLSSLCAEGKVARVFEWEGAPLRCAPLGGVVERAASIEVTAALADGDELAALAVLARDGWYFGKLGEKQASALRKDVDKKLTHVGAARIALGARPLAFRPPSYSPLSFAADGALLVRASSGLFRLPPDGAREELVPEDSGFTAWPLEVTTAAGARLLGVSYSCDRSEASLILAGEPATQLTTLLAPRPGVCGGQPFTERVAPTPISSQNGVRILLGAEEHGAAPSLPPPGSARSANGRFLAVPLPWGLGVFGEQSELWRIDGWDQATGCVVANDGRRAACVRRGQAELYLKSEDTGR